jgi:hypothetical protein
MNGIAGYLAKAIVFIAIGVAVALAVVLPVVLPQRVSASANPVISYVQRGLIGSVNCSNYRDDPAWSYLWIEDSHPCWHADEPGDTSAIDYTVPGPPEASIGASVYFHYRGDSQNFVIDILPYYTPCTGVAAYLHNQQGYLRGTVNYVHIDVAGGVVGTIPSSFEWLGTVSGDQPDLCEETAWTGPHLHQSADSTGNNPFYFNRWDNPWKDHYHEHTIYWPALQSDADGDSYSDSMELRLGTDPQDACPSLPGHRTSTTIGSSTSST